MDIGNRLFKNIKLKVDMFRFEDPSAFYLMLGFIPVVLVIFWAAARQKNRLEKFGNPDTVRRLFNGLPDRKLSYILTGTGLLFLILAAANPQWGTKREKSRVNTRDIFIALDISRSMDAEDVSPSRLEKAKRFAEQLISSRPSDQFGLIFFAGNAYLQMPLTTDHAAATLFVRAASTDMAGTQGTAIEEAIRMAEEKTKENHHKALVVISDGEDHDQEAADAAEEAAGKGWTVFALGVGTTEGAKIPVINEGREEYKSDEEGNPVISALNPELLKSVAENGKGAFYALEGDYRSTLDDLNARLDKMEKRAVDIRSFTEFNSYYQYFLASGLLFLLAGMYFYNRLKPFITN